MSNFWLYRGGVNVLTIPPRHVVFSETWVTNDAPVSNVNTRIGMATCTNRLTAVFGGFTPEAPGWSGLFWQQLWPKPGVHESPIPVQPFSLNLNAPEASFRLQRVGSSGALGLIRLPILSDSSYTDLPHRRRVNVAILAPLMAANLGAAPMSITSGGRTYTNVIFNRSTFTWDTVATYRLLPSTCRVWQRWRPFDIARLAAERAFLVPEPINYPAGR
jgi:hypothetical protein